MVVGVYPACCTSVLASQGPSLLVPPLLPSKVNGSSSGYSAEVVAVRLAAAPLPSATMPAYREIGRKYNLPY